MSDASDRLRAKYSKLLSLYGVLPPSAIPSPLRHLQLPQVRSISNTLTHSPCFPASRPFESGNVEVRIYLRLDDRRGRILCKTVRSGRRMQSSYPITSLRILRADSCLQICRPESRRRLVLWTNLRFTSYERTLNLFSYARAFSP